MVLSLDRAPAADCCSRPTQAPPFRLCRWRRQVAPGDDCQAQMQSAAPRGLFPTNPCRRAIKQDEQARRGVAVASCWQRRRRLAAWLACSSYSNLHGKLLRIALHIGRAASLATGRRRRSGRGLVSTGRGLECAQLIISAGGQVCAARASAACLKLLPTQNVAAHALEPPGSRAILCVRSRPSPGPKLQVCPSL